MARQGTLVAWVTALLVIGGCGSSPAASTPSAMATTPPSVASPTAVPTTPSPTPTPAPTPTPTVNPSAELAVLASDYQTIAVETTTARARCTVDANAAVADLASAKQAAARCLTDFSQVVADFKAVSWGPAQAQADRVIAAVDKLDGLAGTMAGASTVAVFRTAYDKLSGAEKNLLTATSKLRAVLGLPPD